MYKRIHIGRWQNQSKWFASITNINKKWLKKAPTVKLTDSSNYILLDVFKGHYRNSTIQSWQEAGVLIGATASNTNKNQIDAYIKSKIDSATRKWKQDYEQLDSAILAYALCKVTEDIITIKPALETTIKLITNCKGDDGTVYYRSTIPTIRFVDTIGFICPF